MLDAYIIERIRHDQDRSRQRSSQVPLHIERPSHEEERRERETERPADESGAVVIDFHL